MRMRINETQWRSFEKTMEKQKIWFFSFVAFKVQYEKNEFYSN
jgi:hypothetical protein